MNPQAIIFTLILRVLIAIYCYNKAGKLNRNKNGWSFFGFVAPFLAIIWMQFMKPLNSNEQMEEMTSELTQQ